MKAKDALIAWTPAHWEHPTRGMIKIGHLLCSADAADWTDPYSHTGGAANVDWRKLPPTELLAMIFIEFNAITARDGISPLVAHEAFLAIGISEGYRS